jgi:predicted membrane protein
MNNSGFIMLIWLVVFGIIVAVVGAMKGAAAAVALLMFALFVVFFAVGMINGGPFGVLGSFIAIVIVFVGMYLIERSFEGGETPQKASEEYFASKVLDSFYTAIKVLEDPANWKTGMTIIIVTCGCGFVLGILNRTFWNKYSLKN